MIKSGDVVFKLEVVKDLEETMERLRAKLKELNAIKPVAIPSDMDAGPGYCLATPKDRRAWHRRLAATRRKNNQVAAIRRFAAMGWSAKQFQNAMKRATKALAFAEFSYQGAWL